MMCTPVQCQVSFRGVFDDVAQSEAAIFIVSMTALMMSDPFCQLSVEVYCVVGKQDVQRGSISPLHTASSGDITLCLQIVLLTDGSF